MPIAYADLADALSRRTLSLFIGADLPFEVTGLPARSDLARELARRKELDESLSLAEVAQRVSQAGNRWEFTDFIRNALDTVGKSPQSFHRRIVELVRAHQIETVITTAYDNLLELAFQEAGVGVNRVVRGNDVSFVNPDRPTLIKLYGDAQQPDTLVVTDRDHSDLMRDREREPLVDEVRRAFRRNTVLFLGYNLADPDFRFLFDQIAESRFARTAYAVWPGLPEADVRMWRDRGIVILDVDPLGILGEVRVPPAPPHRPEPIITPLVSQSFIGGKDMDFERGLNALKALAEGTHWHNDFIVQEARLRDNLQARRRYGDTETRRADRAEIVERLNALALKYCGVSFNDLCQGIQPTPSARPRPPAEPELQPSPLRRERGWVRFKLQIARLTGLEFEVRAFDTPMGEPYAIGRLPYDPTDLIAVLKVLELGHYRADRFTSAQTEALQRLGLLGNPRLVPDLLPSIGSGLYQALFPGKVGVAFQMALNQARSRRDTVALQLRFDQNAVALARYPWELLHDGHRHLLSGGAVEMTRYITYAEAVTSLPVPPPWRLLYIGARPRDLDKLPDDTERLAVWNGLQPLAETGKLTLDRLDPPTYDALLDRMGTADSHIIHFDGHGTFARRCPECATMHYPHLTTCQSCSTPLDDVPPLGYLAFEDGVGDSDYVSTEEVENVLMGSEVRLVLLSACRSGVVRGESLFGGLGPGFIRAGVPAIVAMQFSVPVKAAVHFAQGFYTALARGETVSRAVAQGRRRLFRRKTWFIPTLYLRSTDDEGKLFIE